MRNQWICDSIIHRFRKLVCVVFSHTYSWTILWIPVAEFMCSYTYTYSFNCRIPVILLCRDIPYTFSWAWSNSSSSRIRSESIVLTFLFVDVRKGVMSIAGISSQLVLVSLWKKTQYVNVHSILFLIICCRLFIVLYNHTEYIFS